LNYSFVYRFLRVLPKVSDSIKRGLAGNERAVADGLIFGFQIARATEPYVRMARTFEVGLEPTFRENADGNGFPRQ
jgi:hypothetical protein